MRRVIVSAVLMVLMSGCSTEFIEEDDAAYFQQRADEAAQDERIKQVAAQGDELSREFDAMPAAKKTTRKPSAKSAKKAH